LNEVKRAQATGNRLQRGPAASRQGACIALIGCGAIAECYHLPALAKHPAVIDKLILVDPNRARAEELSSRFHVPRVSCDYHDVLPDIEGAIIATPPLLHYPIAMDCFRHKVHVLCEKPLATSTAEAQDMVAQASRAGVTLSVNQTRRLFPSYGKIRELIAAGTIGELVSLTYTDGTEFSWPTVSGFYFKANAAAQGVLLDKGVHVLDTICWWLGHKPTPVTCETDSFGGPEAVVALRLIHHQCQIDVRLSSLSDLHNAYRIVGTTGEMLGEIEAWDTVTVIPYQNGKPYKIHLRAREEHYNDFAPRLIANFLDVIQKDVPPLIPASDTLHTIALIEECYRMAKRFALPWYDTLERPDEA
jgi:predicted dehydrogenase